MRYLTIFRSIETEAPPTDQEMGAMGALIEEMTAAGVLVTAEGCAPSRQGFRIRRDGDRLIRTDGPFTETKEVVGGFAIIDVVSADEADHWTRRFLEVAGDGESEVRPLYDEPAA
jgi:hypothetical protein